MTKREEHIQKLDKARAELIHAGPIHARDLQSISGEWNGN